MPEKSIAIPPIHIEKQSDFNSDVLYNETLVDMSVKALGQWAVVKRQFLSGKWFFVSNINKLDFEIRKSNSSVTSIERNRRKYTKEGDGFYRVDEVSFIRKTDEGWKWQNTQGDWEMYNNSGHLVSYGKKAPLN